MIKEGLKHSTFNRKSVCFCLEFKDEEVSSRIEKMIKAAPNRSFLAAQLFSMYKTRYSLNQTKVTQYPSNIILKCMYKFTCACERKYTGRTKRRIFTRCYELIPCKLCLYGSKIFTRVNTKHLMDSKHNVDVSKEFKIIKLKAYISFTPFCRDH